MALPFSFDDLEAIIIGTVEEKKQAKVPKLADAAIFRIYREIEMMNDGHGAASKEVAPSPLYDSIQTLKPGVQNAIAHWQDDAQKTGKDHSLFISRLQGLEAHLAFFQVARDWLLEPLVVVRYTQEEFMTTGIAACVSYRWKLAGAPRDISPGALSPLVSVTMKILNLLGYSAGVTEGSVSGVLRKHKPAGGWGTWRPPAVSAGESVD